MFQAQNSKAVTNRRIRWRIPKPNPIIKRLIKEFRLSLNHTSPFKKSFANDQFNGALVKAQEMLSVAKKLESVVLAGKRESDYRVIRSELLKEIAALTKAKGLADARDSFKKLSRPLARWVGLAKPTNLQVVYCPMAKGSWLQAKGTAVANPYLTNMPKCGTIM